MKENTNKGTRGLKILLISLAVLLAGLAGFIFARSLSYDPSDDYEETAPTEEKANTLPQRTNGKAVFTEVIFSINTETKAVENIMVSILNCMELKLDFVHVSLGITYTMSENLYSKLIPDNPKLPQTVLLSELYDYYQGDRAFEAGMKIVSEMLGCPVDCYTAVGADKFEEHIFCREDDLGISASCMIAEEDAKNAFWGTEGSAEGYLRYASDGTLSNISIDERMEYLDVYNELARKDITFTDAPVKVSNEKTELDINGTSALMIKLLP